MSSSRHITFLIFIAYVIFVAESHPLKRWNKARITWMFDDPYDYLYPRQEKTVRKLIISAFDEWSLALEGLLQINEYDYLRDNGTLPDIRIYFAKKDHNCIEDFDGRGGVVAHSGYPSSGMLHLDGDELWHTGDPRNGDVDMRYVLIHEIGHVLGLRHSREKTSVMRQNYRSTRNQFELSKYDVRAIRKLYS